ncbi:MAG: NAD(+) synthase [Treponema sp.]|nr:NAD(+) synthase [Treponema sp.]
MKYSILRAAAVSPSLIVADCDYNAGQIISCIKDAYADGARLLVFPELCITGYTCGDLFAQDTLLSAALKALLRIADETRNLGIISVVGLPLAVDGVRYNVAAFVNKGEVLAVTPKLYIPNYGEFYERRWFSPPVRGIPDMVRLSDSMCEVPFGLNLLLQDKDDSHFKLAAEICEDAWTPFSPSVRHALNGATVIANLSASNELVGKADYRRQLVSSLSAKSLCAYVYSDAGHGESSTDMVFSGHNIIAMNGSIRAESPLFDGCGRILFADLDLERIYQDRLRTTSFASCREDFADDSYRTVFFDIDENIFGDMADCPIGFQSASKSSHAADRVLVPPVEPHPFVPEKDAERAERSRSVVEMQAEGLAKRLSHIHAKGAVIGLSGGLDSTLALLVTCRAFDKCGLDRKGILAVTMPCFGTSSRTRGNAYMLAESSGCSIKEVDIRESVLCHFKDIGQDESVHDVTYENAQARERTQVLMDIANQTGSIVIGTGDLSELALGWCTYNGDQMSMYGVNASIPKSLVRYLVSYFSDEADKQGNSKLATVLRDILATPVSPELLPPSDGEIAQKTEEIVGPYELHDFFLYYVLRWGFPPAKIYFLACMAFSGKKAQDSEQIYSDEIILRWLKSFYRRFFAQQFKRSCMPDGAKVGTVSLSPRGDWRMPSDASASLWLKELEALETK